ncbi:NADH-quinone oxidoreductase subunit C [Pelagibacteraceae bacterium]|jgi:NADH-quinone oxidoreductase subunit C|nr:NADH-quinone oxidoreductase subunit C [Pelagibacteraceae bacterium]
MSEIYQNLKKLVLEKKELKLNDVDLTHDNLILNCDVDNVIHNIDILKRSPEFKFRQLIDILGVDYPQQSKRFEVIYLFLSHENNFRISLKIKIGDEEIVPTLTDTFPSANWQEREVFDMYGIRFANHPDLRRILTDYEFEGYPLRKDFPLTGYKEVRYSAEHQKVIYEPVKLAQDYRDFNFESPWEGSEYIKKEQDKVEEKK